MTSHAIRGWLSIATVLFAVCLAAAAERSYPVDCWPDRLVEWNPVAANPLSLFGAPFVPGTMLGSPGDSVPQQNSLTVASFGFGGSATLAFDDIVIEDRPGPDFIVFENAFFALPLPVTASDDFTVFVEPARVEVSADGVQWTAFPYDATAVADASGILSVNRELWLRLDGLAGVTPTFTGNWTFPNVRDDFDPQGQGGVSGAGGDAFDLADIGLTEARFVRITDLDTQNGFPGQGEGFDLDAIVVLHGRPVAPVALDTDGDGLSDMEEERLFGSEPDLPDSDGDGTDDGREVAGCRDPGSFDEAPWRHHEPRLWMVPTGPCHEVRWTFLGTGVTYDLIRGDLSAVSAPAGGVDLGSVECLEDGALTPRWSCDGDALSPGEARFFLVRAETANDYGRSSALDERTAFTDCP